MPCNLSVFILLSIFINFSISSEVLHQHEHKLLNSEVLNKKLLPDVKYLLKGNSGGDRQKFLQLLNSMDFEGFKFVSGEFLMQMQSRKST